MSFFDTTPLGRIINRFSKDVDTMDNRTSDSYRMFLQTFGMIVATLVLIIVIFYWFILALLPLALLFMYSASFYRSTGPSPSYLSNRSPRSKAPRRHPTIPRVRTFWRIFDGTLDNPCVWQTSRVFRNKLTSTRRHEPRLLYHNSQPTVARCPS